MSPPCVGCLLHRGSSDPFEHAQEMDSMAALVTGKHDEQCSCRPPSMDTPCPICPLEGAKSGGGEKNTLK